MIVWQADLSEVQEIEEFVRFTPYEENIYKEDQNVVKNAIQNYICQFDDNCLLGFVPEKDTILQSIKNLKAKIISCGEHISNQKQSSNQEQQNIIFSLICSKKHQIVVILVEIVTSLINDSQVYWIQKDFRGVENCYEELFKLIESVRYLNSNYEKLEKIDFEEKFLENAREEVGEPPRKIRKICANQAEMTELRRNAMEPLKIDNFRLIHLMKNVQDLAKHSAKAEEWIKDAGGIAKIEEKINSSFSNEKSANVLKCEKIERDFIEKMGKLNDLKDKCSKIVQKLVEWYEMYRNKEDIGRRLREKRRELLPIFEDLSFWPIFEEPRKYFEDNYHHIDDENKKPKKEYPNWLHSHKTEICMGACKLTFGYLYPTYKIAQDYRIYRNLLDYLKLVNKLTCDLMEGLRILMKNSANFETIDNAFPCQHNFLYQKVPYDENRRKADTNRLNCDICRVSHTLADFRFAIGANSFHGYRKKTGHLAIVKLIDLILKEERRVKQEDFGIFERYFSALNEFANSMQIHLKEFLKYEKDKRCATNRKTVFDLRIQGGRPVTAKNEIIWMNWYRKMIKYSHLLYPHIFKTKMPELKSRFNEFTYLLNVCHQQNSSETKNDETLNCCPICCRVFDRIAIFPCAHQVCDQCLQHMKDLRSNSISCINCRRNFKFDEIMIASKQKNDVSENTKLKKTIELIKQILEDDQKNQIVLFTNFSAGEAIWNVIADVLRNAKLPFIDEHRVDFGNPENSRILLSCTSSIFPVFASHAIFIDPTYSNSEIQKSIRRISRFGSLDKRVTVYHVYVERTIDEELRKLAKNGQNLKESELTIGQIRQIFGISQNV